MNLLSVPAVKICNCSQAPLHPALLMGKSPLVPNFVSLSENPSFGVEVRYFYSDPNRKFCSGHKPEINQLLKVGEKRGCADRQASYELVQGVNWLLPRTNVRTDRTWRIRASQIEFGPRFCSIELEEVEDGLKRARSPPFSPCHVIPKRLSPYSNLGIQRMLPTVYLDAPYEFFQHRSQYIRP